MKVKPKNRNKGSKYDKTPTKIVKAKKRPKGKTA